MQLFMHLLYRDYKFYVFCDFFVLFCSKNLVIPELFTNFAPLLVTNCLFFDIFTNNYNFF